VTHPLRKPSAASFPEGEQKLEPRNGMAVIRVCRQVLGAYTSLVPRPSTPPVFDRFQYAKTEGEGARR